MARRKRKKPAAKPSASRPEPFKHVMVVLYLHLSVDREILRGIQQYVQETRKRWSIIAAARYIPSPETFREIEGWELDGVIGSADTEELSVWTAKYPFPFVNTSGQYSVAGVPTVSLDEQAIGRMAAEYFLDQGFENIAFFGIDYLSQSELRYQGFREVLASRSMEAPRINRKKEIHPENPESSLWKFLTGAPRPVGLFASADHLARETHELCRLRSLDVPEEVAILGVDDDELVCNSVQPTISSIRWPARMTGYQAAKILDAMMQGEKIRSEPVLLAPESVHVRGSTSTIPIQDRTVAKAVRFIRENLLRPSGDGYSNRVVSVEDVMENFRSTRRWLDVRFAKVLGRTVFGEIGRHQIDHLRHLLRETDWTLEVLAAETGYKDQAAMFRAFKRAEGVAPGAYRKKFRHVKTRGR